MKNIITLSLVLFFALSISAQQRYFDERYISTQSFVNPVLINPGATGFDTYHHVIASYRNKWASFPDSPKSFILSYDGPVGNRVGAGAILMSDRAGGLETTKGQASVSYGIESPTNKIGFGLSFEYISHGVANSVLSNAIIDTQDPYLLSRLNGTNYFDASFGVFGLYDDKVIYGVTLPGLLKSRLDTITQTVLDERDFGYILQLGYKFQANADLIVEPSIIVKSINQVPMHTDINVLMRFLDDKFNGGVTYSIGADNRLGFLIVECIQNLFRPKRSA